MKMESARLLERGILGEGCSNNNGCDVNQQQMEYDIRSASEADTAHIELAPCTISTTLPQNMNRTENVQFLGVFSTDPLKRDT